MNQNLILVVDDEPDICGEISGFLSENNYQTMVAKNGDDALKIFKNNKPVLVLTDYMMPGMNGIELLKKIKLTNRDVNVIMMSGVSDIKTAVAALKEDAFDFLQKPVDLDELLVKVKEAIKRTIKIATGKPASAIKYLSHEEVSSSPPASVMSFFSNLDEYSNERYRSEFYILIADYKFNKVVVFNLDEVEYINNVGLNLLVDLKKALDERCHDVHACNVKKQVSGYLSAIGYDSFLNVEMKIDDVFNKLHLK